MLRVAPSPTGFLHIGTVYAAYINKKLAQQSNGKFILRIEDTDKTREVENGIEIFTDGFKGFGIEIDEGVVSGDKQVGEYGPYIQSERLDIYKVFAKDLISKGLAYPCFATEQELEDIRNKQNELGVRTGYYGKWAKWRDASIEDINKELEKGTPFVIRLYSQGDIENQFTLTDLVKGNLTLRENDMDSVLLKSDGFPTYHLAHPIDDTLMGISFVLRGDEWYPSVSLHIELFKALGFEQIDYGHFSPMMKIDVETGGKRKLSKRKDPESDVQYYISNGYPIEAVKEYLLNIANSNFYDWRKQNPVEDLKGFELKLDKLNRSGALFDMVKLEDVCKEYVSRLDAKTVYKYVLDWANGFNSNLYTQMVEHKDYFVSIFGIEREGSKVRKDIVKWVDVPSLIEIFFKESFNTIEIPTLEMDKDTQKDILSDFIDIYHPGDTVEEWFSKVKNVATKNNFCTDYKEYEANPKKYNGKVGDVAMVLRVAITHKLQSPDLYQVMQALGEEVVLRRLKDYKDLL
jgi:glutamyl-tRNA synthetase